MLAEIGQLGLISAAAKRSNRLLNDVSSA